MLCLVRHYRLVFIFMNRIHRKVEYALMALKYMNEKPPGERSTVKEITVALGCPVDMTARVLQALGHRGVLGSEAGPHGGYWISRAMSAVSLFDLMETVLGPVELAKCLSDDVAGGCELRGTCNIVSPIQNLNKRINQFYSSLSLAEILTPPRLRESSELSAQERVAR